MPLEGIPKLSKIWLKVINLENSLFPQSRESLKIEEFSSKESKLGHRPIIDINPKNSQTLRDKIKLRFHRNYGKS